MEEWWGLQVTRLRQQWVFDYHDFNDPNPAYDEEFSRLQQNYELGQDSTFNMNLDWVDEEELKEYPLLVQAMKDQGITSCIVLIWW